MIEPKQLEWIKSYSQLSEQERDDRRKNFFAGLKQNLAVLQEYLAKVNDHWSYEDGVYRFYHQSFKVYKLQDLTSQVLVVLRALSQDYFDPRFLEIIYAGTGLRFDLSHNDNWSEHTRPILEAFFHAKYFLEMLYKYGQEFNSWPDGPYPSGWAAICSLYYLW